MYVNCQQHPFGIKLNYHYVQTPLINMLLISLLCVAAVCFWLWNRRNARPDEPPRLPGAWPIIGNMSVLMGDTSKLWATGQMVCEQMHRLGGVIRFSLGPKTIYVVVNPNDIATVANACLDKIYIYDFSISWLGHGLFTSSGSTWKNHRKWLNPAFSPRVLNSFIDAFNDQARNLVRDLKKEVGKGYFDYYTYSKMNTAETVALTVLGADFGVSEVEKKTYVENIDALLYCMMKRFQRIWLHLPQIFRFSKLKKIQNTMIKFQHNVTNSILQRKKSKLHENIGAEESLTQDTNFKSFLDILLELSQQGLLNDREVREHTDTIIFGGIDTSAISLTFIMLLLGAHPDVQDKVVAELKEVFGDEDRNVTKNDLLQLPFLDAVIKESLRLYPVGPVIARQIDKDIKLQNCTLYAGHMCALLLFGAQTHPCWGPDRYKFRPERWLDPAQLPEDPNAFAAFSVGRRACIGKVYATMFMKIIITHLLRQYKITADDRQLQVKVDALLKPASGNFISIENRI